MVIIFALLCVWAPSSYAQDVLASNEETHDEELVMAQKAQDGISAAEYKVMLIQALNQRSDFDFGYFRTAYSNLDIYAPIASDIQTKILTLAFKIQELPASQERTDALEEYTKLVLQHLANIDIVITALSMAEQDRRFGSPSFYKWMYRGLLQNIYNSGDGSKLTNAFRVITLGEETALLSKLRLKVLNTKAVKEGFYYYNMHRVLDPKTAQTYTIFVDTTKPMSYLEEQEKNNPRPLTLNRE